MFSLRMPRGLWDDLETTVIQQDRQFLTEVAHSLGLPPSEVIRRCLGTGGVPTQVVSLPPPCDSEICPWWECYGDGLWRRCAHLRLSALLPCLIHERCKQSAVARLDSDPIINELPWAQPVRYRGHLYWVDPANGFARREDGSHVVSGYFKWLPAQTWIWCPKVEGEWLLQRSLQQSLESQS